MRIMLLLLCAVNLSLISVGCKSSAPAVKELDESSAKELVQEEPFEVRVNDFHPLFKRTLKDYTAADAHTKEEACMKRLIENGFVVRSVESKSYPKISGTFSVETRDFRLEMVPSTNLLTGTYIQHDGSLFAGSYKASGSVESDGKVQLTIEGFGTESAFYHEDGSVAYLDFPGRSWKGNGTGQRVQANWYTYAWSPQLEKQLRHKNDDVFAIVGKFEVSSVSNLRLVADTKATAKINWKASLNSLGKSIFPEQPPAGEADVAFGKKPDGTWFFDTTDRDN